MSLGKQMHMQLDFVSHSIILFECVSSQAMVMELQDTWVLWQAMASVSGHSSVKLPVTEGNIEDNLNLKT